MMEVKAVKRDSARRRGRAESVHDFRSKVPAKPIRARLFKG
jgi:hypothetical protein